jgi:hypothetical protein
MYSISISILASFVSSISKSLGIVDTNGMHFALSFKIECRLVIIILKIWHKPSTLIAKAMCQFISVVNIDDGRRG